MNTTTVRRTATVDYRVSRVPVLCKDCRYVSFHKAATVLIKNCRQDVGLYPARHVCNDPATIEAMPPVPIIDLKTMNLKPPPSSIAENPSRVAPAKVAVGKGWQAVRNMNWRDMTKKDVESNGSRMWGKLLDAAKQKIHDIRDGGNGASPRVQCSYH